MDFKVRILDRRHGRGHPCTGREPRRHAGERWYTNGVSPNIIDASFEALIDSIVFKLWSDGIAPAVTRADGAAV